MPEKIKLECEATYFMRSPFTSVKDKLYYYFVLKNEYIKQEYTTYVNSQIDEHRKYPWKHWWILIQLNYHYRIKREESPLFVFSRLKGKGVPYSLGIESEKRHSVSPYRFAADLMNYDVISFDIFDTLIFRYLNKPEDLFILVGEKLDIYDFFKIRIKSEQEVRLLQRTKYNNNEVTLDEIYDRVEFYTGIDGHLGSKIEFQTECDMCFANAYMLQVFNILKAAGKRIYATSNMYIPKRKMRELLKICNFDGFEDILISCDYRCNKSNGELFKILKKHAKTTNIVHIGDNKNADIQGAKLANIVAKYYQSCRDLGDPHRSIGMSPLIESAYRGIINSTLHNGVEKYSKLWEYGFIYGGILAFGYVNWIHQNAIRDNITNILFLSRDGYILKKIYDSLFNDISSNYVFWSRTAALRSVCAGEREPFLTRLFEERCGTGDSIESMLKIGGIQSLSQLLLDNGIDPKLPLIKENIAKIWEILVNNWELVNETLLSNQEFTKNYVKKIIAGHKRVAIVDIGWTGRSITPLIKLIQRIGHNKEDIKLYLLGSKTEKQNIAQIINKNIICYMFDANNNKDIYNRMMSESMIGHAIIETLFTAPHNSFLGFDDNGNMEFLPIEINNSAIFSDIGRGILNFCELYNYAFSKYPYLSSISGSDVFFPIKQLLNNKEIANDYIGSISYSKGLAYYDQEKLSKVLRVEQ